MMYIANEACIYLASYLILWLWLKEKLDTHLQTQTHRHTYLGGVDIVQAQQQYLLLSLYHSRVSEDGCIPPVRDTAFLQFLSVQCL